MFLNKNRGIRCIALFYLFNILIIGKSGACSFSNEDPVIVLKGTNYSVGVIRKGFRYSILNSEGKVLLESDPTSGLLLLNSPVTDSRLLSKSDSGAVFEVINNIGIKAQVNILLYDHYFKLSVNYKNNNLKIRGSIVARTQGLTPAYGLADHAAFRTPYSTEVTGFESNYFGALSDSHSSRLVSNFVIFPKQGVACINIDPHKKIIRITKNILAQGSYYTDKMSSLYYFIGTVKQIYAGYLKVRDDEGYKVYKPKYAWFGVGWEAFGALGWQTNHITVTKDVDHYLKLGFPLSWMVLGSGFWPDNPKDFATTSFGMWDKQKYPYPKQFIEHFHKEGLKFILGLRIAFIPNGPYTKEGIEKGYFIKKDGISRLFKVGFPKPNCYFLDASNPDAVKWYISLCDKWKAFGVDGYKEDLYGYDIHGLPDNKVDPINEALMNQGVYVMGRNGYVGSPMDISRFNDFNYNQDQDRGPVNGLAFAYSDFPNVYPDIIGGTGLTDRQFGKIEKQKIGKYLMREAQYAAVNPSMSFGFGPWNLDDPQVLEVCRNAAQLHERLQPYIYSAAIHAYKTGFPYTLTPLPLAYPNDSTTYYRENDSVRGYQWLIGSALMAVPLYGNDYATSNTRNIYLPKGKWIDYDNGKVYVGPTVLENFEIPANKTPLFIGGTGFVVEKINRILYGRIYPIGYNGHTVFFDKDGKTESAITIKDFGKNTPTVYDQTIGKEIEAKLQKYAWQFEFIPGHNYLIQ